MFLHILYPYIRFTVGTLYPSYKTWKSLKRKDETNRRHWMKYWVSFGAFQMLEIFSDLTLAFILPFYTELKLLVIMWLVMGTKLVFDTVVNRELTRREKSIDRWLNKIGKCRNEIIAILWLELSQCSLKILSALMSGGLSFLLVRSPEVSKANSPVNSDAEYEDEEEAMDIAEDLAPPAQILKLENNTEKDNNENEYQNNKISVKLEDMMQSVELMQSQQQIHSSQPQQAFPKKSSSLVTIRPYRTRLRTSNQERLQ